MWNVRSMLAGQVLVYDGHCDHGFAATELKTK